MKRSKVFAITVSLLCLILVVAGPTLALEKAQGVLKKARFYSETDLTTWTDGSTKDMFNVNVKLRGNNPQCIEIRFSASMSTESQDYVRCYVDGVQAEPGGVFYNFPGQLGYQNGSYVWWQCGLASGGASHNVRVEYDPRFPGEFAGFGHRNLIIHYKR